MTENPNEKSAVTKGTMAAGFSVASVWFGTHVGAGFATGNQVITYFVQYGWTAVLYPLISMGILAYVIYVIMKFARLRGLDNYADTFRELWSPYPWLSITFEIFYIIIILAAVAAAISGAALLVDDVLGFQGAGLLRLAAEHDNSRRAAHSAVPLRRKAHNRGEHGAVRRHPYHCGPHDNRRHREPPPRPSSRPSRPPRRTHGLRVSGAAWLSTAASSACPYRP